MQVQNIFNKSILFFLLLFVFINTHAQTGLNFQGVARTTNNVILASQPISLRLSILQGSASGTVEYSEIRKVTTNVQGLFAIVIGDADAISTIGNFSTINWKNTPKFLKIEMDAAAGNNFINMGTTQFQYVAYAQFASAVDADNILGIVPISKGGTGANSLAGVKNLLSIDKINNTADVDKPISSKMQTGLDFKINIADTAAMLANRIGKDTLNLSSRINAKANTLDVTKSLANKVDKVTGKVLSTNDFTTDEKVKLAAITGSNTGDQDLSSYATNTALALKENASNKSTATDLGGVSPSDILYPTQKAVKDYVTANANSGGIADGSISTIKLADLAVTDTKIASGINKSKVGLSNVENTALSTWTGSNNITTLGTISSGTWSGTAIAISNGGTGATSAAAARTNLGLVIGTNVQAPLIAGTDYQTPLTAGTNYIVPNSAITAATKTKITYDTKGFVTSGADATTADIAPSTNRNYLTDIQAGVLSNTSGTNTGDETASSIKTKLGIATLTGINTGDQDLSSYATNTSLGLKENASNKSSAADLGGTSPSDVLFPTQKAVKDYVTASVASSGVADGGITTIKLADLVVTDAKLASGINKSKVGLSNVENTALSTWAGSNNLTTLGTISSGTWSGTAIAISNGGTGATSAAGARANLGLVIGTNVQAPLTAGTDYLTPNSSVTASTKTKITYDTKGLVTSGADATTADIAPSMNRNYLTDVQSGVISNTSGINTGDETTNTIKAKLGITTLSGSNTGDQDLSSYATNTALALKENASNKSTATDLGGVSPSDILYPTQKAVKDYVTANVASIGIADGSISTIKLADLAVTDAKLASGINKSKVGLSNVENTTLSTWAGSNNLTTLGTISSGTWSGTAIAISNGGTGATSAAGARANLGLLIGTNVQAPLIAGTDYLTPTGSALGLTSFPILNQNTTGNALTATTASTVITNANLTGDVTSVGNTTTIANNAVLTSKVLDANITYAKIQNVTTTDKVLGRVSSGAGVVEEISTTGTGNVVRATSPILVTPNIGAATGSNLTTNNIINSGKIITGSSSAASTSAVFEANSTTQGLLLPRMTLAERNAISSPVAGLVIYCTNCGTSGEMEVYDGSEWKNMLGKTRALVIGEPYQGGLVGYILQSGDPGYDVNVMHGLIVSTSDLDLIRWHNGSNLTTNASAVAFGTGLANTNKIITAQGAVTTSYAAGLARSHNGGGFTDWYLPSRDEMYKIYLNRFSISGFTRYPSGNFHSYWTSSENTTGASASNAYIVSLQDGSLGMSEKYQAFRIRPVRAF